MDEIDKDSEKLFKGWHYRFKYSERITYIPFSLEKNMPRKIKSMIILSKRKKLKRKGNMKDFLDKRLMLLQSEMKASSAFGNEHPTSVAEFRENPFRKFISDIFPYYDAFKGKVNGKSCDFVLANNLDHPRYDSLSVPDFYPHVVMSAIDTVIDLKGTTNPNEFKSGIEQANKVKSLIRPLHGSTGMTQEYDYLLKYWTRLTARHGLVFQKGTNKNILGKIKSEIGGSPQKFRVEKNGVLTEEIIETGIKILNEKIL